MRYYDKVAKANNNNNHDLLGSGWNWAKSATAHTLSLSHFPIFLALPLFLSRIWASTMVTGARGAS